MRIFFIASSTYLSSQRVMRDNGVATRITSLVSCHHTILSRRLLRHWSSNHLKLTIAYDVKPILGGASGSSRQRLWLDLGWLIDAIARETAYRIVRWAKRVATRMGSLVSRQRISDIILQATCGWRTESDFGNTVLTLVIECIL